VAREVGRELSADEIERIQLRHGTIFRELLPERRPLPGARKLLEHLRARDIVHGIATSGRRPEIDLSLDALGVGDDTVVIDRGGVARAKPEPDLFLACQAALGVEPEDCYVVGDASGTCWPPARADMLSVGSGAVATARTSSWTPAPFASTTMQAELLESLDELGFDA